ncbi:MAG TPA: folate-binding protein [Solirubrobacteraceae bacterium]|nr:folate-binding protein [Solirubrobacteraceae bacterium]
MTVAETVSLAEQYAALTERCGLVDRSERGKLALTGADAVEFLNGQVSNELLDLQPGEGRYATFLTHKGKMLGDLRILAAGEPGSPAAELLLDTERTALQALFDAIWRFKVGYRVELHKRTLESSLFSLVGPEADRVATAAVGPLAGSEGVEHDRAALPGEAEHSHVPAQIDVAPARLIRTDVGLDVLFAASAMTTVQAALERSGAAPVDEQAAEILRVERGRPRYGLDVDETTIPQEAGLNERAVSFTKGCYVGQETVARLHYKGKPNRHLRGLCLSEPVTSGTELLLAEPGSANGERPVGSLGSSVLSPARGPIGLALLRREAEPGATLKVAGCHATAIVVELPFG